VSAKLDEQSTKKDFELCDPEGTTLRRAITPRFIRMIKSGKKE